MFLYFGDKKRKIKILAKYKRFTVWHTSDLRLAPQLVVALVKKDGKKFRKSELRFWPNAIL